MQIAIGALARLKAIVPSVVSAVAGNQCRFCGGLLINARCVACHTLASGHFRHPARDARELGRQNVPLLDQHCDPLVCA